MLQCCPKTGPPLTHTPIRTRASASGAPQLPPPRPRPAAVGCPGDVPFLQKGCERVRERVRERVHVRERVCERERVRERVRAWITAYSNLFRTGTVDTSMLTILINPAVKSA